MNVTVTQLSPYTIEKTWPQLVAHVAESKSDLVLLPEMIFSPWLALDKDVSAERWADAMAVHDVWLGRLEELAPATVVGSRPVLRNGLRQHEAFVWDIENGLRGVHAKYYLPDEPGFWEATWYERGDGSFDPFEAAGATGGMLMCTEMWFTEHARSYAKSGAHLLFTPRCSHFSGNEKWLMGGRAAAVMGGAYSLSSNHVGQTGDVQFGGSGWVIDPNGKVLAVTSVDAPFVTVAVDLDSAENAKQTYPRYIRE